MQAYALGGRVLVRALDVLLPPRCLLCRAPVERNGHLCAACWSTCNFIADPVCAACGLPFEHDMGPDALCGACMARAPAYDCARAVMVYDDVSRELVLRFKHGDQLQGAPAFGEWLARAGGYLLDRADLIVPVPLHRRRLWRRRYNQAAVLTAALSRVSGLPCIPDLLARTRATPSQAGRGAAARRRNVEGAFAVRKGREHLVEGRGILLVDDVLTTGATAEACARRLKRAKARRVDVLTLARVVRPSAPSI